MKHSTRTEAEAVAGVGVLERLRGHRAALYRSGKVPTATGGFIDAFPTGLTEGAGECLRELVVREVGARTGRDGGRGGRTIEVGMALGFSTLFMVEGVLMARGGDDDEEARGWGHIAVDPYQFEQWGDAGVRSVEAAGVGSMVRVMREDSLLALPRLVGEVERGEAAAFEVGFVDGGHYYENAFIDTYYMHRLVRPGGLIIVDDVWMPGIALAVSYFEKNLGSVREAVGDPRGARRLAVLRTAERRVERAWDHFVGFGG